MPEFELEELTPETIELINSVTKAVEGLLNG